MDLRQLRYFLAIAQEGQITRAAKLLNMEQPPLSRQLRQMEEALGVKLFDRCGRQLRLTGAGEKLQQKAEQLLLQFDETMREVKEIDDGTRGVLSLGTVVSCISLLPKRIDHFRATYPQVKFKILEGDHFYLGEQLDKRVIELIVARLPFEAMINPQDYSVLPLPSDPFVAVIPSSWEQFSGHQPIFLRDLSQFPLITLKSEKTVHMHEQFVRECNLRGFEPNIIGECSSVAIIMSLVAEGIGATVFPKSVMSSFPTDVVRMLDIQDADFQSAVGIVWLKNKYLSSMAQNFIDSFQTEHDLG